MSVTSPVSGSVASGVAVPVVGHGSSYPATLALLWPLELTASGILQSAVGPAPVFTDTPMVDADGVAPGDGPSFTSAVVWEDGGTRMMRMTANTASADLVGDVEIGGGFYAYSGGIKARHAVLVEQLLMHTENFSDAVWFKSNITAVPSTDHPVGFSGSYLITSTASSSIWLQRGNFVVIGSAKKYTASVCAKKGTGFLQITYPSATFGASQYANFNLDSGALGTIAGGTAKIAAVGDGWYRCEFTATSTASAASGFGPAITLVPNSTSGRLAGITGLSAYVTAANLTQSDGSVGYSYAAASTSFYPPVALGRALSWGLGDEVAAVVSVDGGAWRVGTLWTFGDPEESAASVATMRVSDGAVIYATNPTLAADGSSMTKMMTGIVAERYITDYDATVTITSDDLAGGDSGTTYLGVGDVATVRDVLHCTMIHSDNVGAMAIGRVVGAIIDPLAATAAAKLAAFLAKMNDVASEIGSSAAYTAPWNFVVATSTAQCKTMRHIKTSSPIVLSISGKATYGVTITGANARTFTITHTLPISSFPEFIAGKTGTGDSKGSVCMLWSLNGTEYITTILRSDPYTERYNDLRAILEYQYYKDGQIYGPGVAFATMPALSLASSCPGSLLEIQEWSKVASAREIGNVK